MNASTVIHPKTGQQPDKKHKKTLSSLLAGSFILSLFYRLSCTIYRKARTSLIGSFFTSYDEENEKLHSGICGHLLQKCNLGSRFVRPARFFFARLFDNSLILQFFQNKMCGLLHIPLFHYGLVLVSFACADLITEGIGVIRGGFQEVPLAGIISALIVLVCGIALLSARKSTGSYILQSRCGHLICFDLMDANETAFSDEEPKGGSGVVAVILGFGIGLLSLFVSPLYLILLPVGLIGLYAILKIPEFGVILAIFLMPFAPTMLLVMLMGYVFVSYLLKLIAGRRILKCEPIDFAVILFLGLYIIGSPSSIDFSVSLAPTLVFVCFILGYFLVVNLIRNEKWFNRAMLALVGSASLEALYGVYQYLFGAADTTWQDKTMFDDISGRVVSTLENPNVLAEYLILCLPVIFAYFWIRKNPSQKLLLLLPLIACGACLIFTWSRGAWLGFLIAMVVLLLMLTRKSLVFFLFGVLALPLSPWFLPESIIHRFTSIGNLADTSTSYRVAIWQGAINMIRDHFFSGIGSGIDLFPLVYPKYALSGIEAAPHSHNLYLQLLVEMGIWGLIFFAIIGFYLAKISIKGITVDRSNPNRFVTAGLFAGLLAVLAQGMTDYIWYNYRLFLIFWLVAGLLVARARISKNQTATGSIK